MVYMEAGGGGGGGGGGISYGIHFVWGVGGNSRFYI